MGPMPAMREPKANVCEGIELFLLMDFSTLAVLQVH